MEWDQRDRLLGGLLVGGGPMDETSACGSQGEGDGAKPAVGKARSGQSARRGVPKVRVLCRRWNWLKIQAPVPPGLPQPPRSRPARTAGRLAANPLCAEVHGVSAAPGARLSSSCSLRSAWMSSTASEGLREFEGVGRRRRGGSRSWMLQKCALRWWITPMNDGLG